MKIKVVKALSLVVAVVMLFSVSYAQMIVSFAAVEPTTDTTQGNKIGLEKLNGEWVYYGADKKIDKKYVGLAKNDYGWWFVKNGTIDFSYTGTANNIYGTFYVTKGKLDTKFTGLAKDSSLGWIYLKNGKFDKSYTGMAKNQYGWWYVRNGKLDQTYVGLAKNDYGWWYLVNGTINKTYNSLASNDYGWWYIKNGTINKYNGTFKNNMGTWNVKNGKATITSRNFSSITKYEVDTKSVSAKAGTVVRAWRIQQSGLFVEVLRVQYGNKITQRFRHSFDSQVNIEKTLTYQPYVNIALVTTTDPARLGIASAKTLLNQNTAYVEDMAKKNGAVIAINAEASVYKNDHSTVRNGKVEVSSTNVSSVKYLHIYRDGSWQFKAMDNANINSEIRNGLYNTVRTQQTMMISNGKAITTDKDRISENSTEEYYNNRTMLGRISNNKTVFAVGEFMPTNNISKVLVAYGVKDAILLNGGNCSSMYVKGIGNTTGAIGKSLKSLNKVNVLETEFFGSNHMIGNNSQGYEMLGGPCKEPDMIYFK